jgi:radical SAM protein with 4Fe4S-binding SPASM domain
MEAKPVKRKADPRYPTRLEALADRELLEKHMPAAWKSCAEIAGAAAILLTINGCMAQHSHSGNVKAIVAPIFNHGEGRAADGCEVVNPPVFLSEQDAMQVIGEVKLSSHINRHCYRKERCELAQRQISVDPLGHIYPCVQFTRAGAESDFCIGHVGAGIDEASRQRLYAASTAEKEPCSRCAIRERCNHTCGCLNWQTTGALTEVSPILCRHEQMLVPIADEIGRRLYRKRNSLFLHKHYNVAYPVLSALEDSLK